MKKNTRLLIRLTYVDGGQQSFGYDAWYPRHKTLQGLLSSIEDDFATIPEHVEAWLFYDVNEQNLGHIDNWDSLKDNITELMGIF